MDKSENRDMDKGSEKGVGDWEVKHEQINPSAGHERRLQGVRHGGMLIVRHLGVEIGGGCTAGQRRKEDSGQERDLSWDSDLS